MADISNVQIGVQNISFGEKDLGHTDGGCEFTYEPEYTSITVDLYGSTSVDEVLTGEVVKVTVPLAETTLDNLKIAIPTATVVEDVGSSSKGLKIGSIVGKRLSEHAEKLTLHPTWLPKEDKSFDIVLHKAVITSETTLSYKIDEKVVYEVEFTALIDESQEDGAFLATIGDVSP